MGVSRRTVLVLGTGVVVATLAEIASLAYQADDERATEPATPPPSGRRVTFFDDFTSPTLDTTKWNARHDSTSYDTAYTRPENVTIRDGICVLSAKREPYKGRAWTSGYIDTRGKFTQKFGRFEARVKIPTTAGDSSGLWPSFWMRPDNGEVTGEIDILEAWGEPILGLDLRTGKPRTDHRSGAGSWTLHEDTRGTGKKQNGSIHPPPGRRLSDDFHVYGVDWTRDGFTFLLDGKPVKMLENADLGFDPRVFDAPFHMRIHYAVGSTYWGPTGQNTKSPSELLVDWVRVTAPA